MTRWVRNDLPAPLDPRPEDERRPRGPVAMVAAMVVVMVLAVVPAARWCYLRSTCRPGSDKKAPALALIPLKRVP